jgi:hypothetical protein
LSEIYWVKICLGNQKQSANYVSICLQHSGHTKTLSLQSPLTSGIQNRTPVNKVRQTIQEMEAHPCFYYITISPAKPHSTQRGLLTGWMISLFFLVLLTRLPYIGSSSCISIYLSFISDENDYNKERNINSFYLAYITCIFIFYYRSKIV